MPPERALEAFADIARRPSKRGVCHGCRKDVDSREAVNVRVTATTRDPQKSSGSVGLASSGRTFCPGCARATYDAALQVVEGGP